LNNNNTNNNKKVSASTAKDVKRLAKLQAEATAFSGSLERIIGSRNDDLERTRAKLGVFAPCLSLSVATKVLAAPHFLLIYPRTLSALS